MGIIIQFIAVIMGLVGFFGQIPTIFFVGGFLSLLLDIIGFSSGKLKPLFPIFLYIGGYILVGSWHGILFGSLVGQIFEIVFIVLALTGGGTYVLLEKVKQLFTKKS